MEKSDSDIDIMILLDLSDEDIKAYRHNLSDVTYDFNMEYTLDIKPIAKSDLKLQRQKKCDMPAIMMISMLQVKKKQKNR